MMMIMMMNETPCGDSHVYKIYVYPKGPNRTRCERKLIHYNVGVSINEVTPGCEEDGMEISGRLTSTALTVARFVLTLRIGRLLIKIDTCPCSSGGARPTRSCGWRCSQRQFLGYGCENLCDTFA